MWGRATTAAIFTVRQLQEKFMINRKKQHFAFADLEKSLDRVTHEVIDGQFVS